jgi:hypothetical protein
MAASPFPREALDANRSGHLTPDQVTLYKEEAATDRRNLLLAGVAVTVFGAVILFGAVSGRIAGGRLEPLALGGGILLFGLALAWFGGIRGSSAKAARAASGRVTSIEGSFRRDRRDRSDDTDGHVSPGNQYEYYLLVDDRRFIVSRDQWDAAPEDGVVRVYLLGDSDRIVNLEKTADAPVRTVPGMVAASAITPSDPGRPLGEAILGSWHSSLMDMTYTFRADGSVTATSLRAGSGEQRWAMAGPDTIEIDGARLQAIVSRTTLALGEPPRLLAFERVG